MNPENNNSRTPKVAVVLFVVILMAGAFLLGSGFGKSDEPNNNSATNSTTNDVENDNEDSVKSLVSYTVPDGWSEAICESSPNAVYFVPASSEVDCNENPSAPFKISVDPGDATDCNQLQNVQNVKKHVCISLYINDQRSLKASTEYLDSSEYGQATTVDAYYIDTGSGVVKVEHVYSGSSDQREFDQLANSVKLKS